MNKRTFIAVFTVLGLAIIFFVINAKQNKAEPTVIKVNASSRELTIDNKIDEAEIIMIGEVKAKLPSKWKFQSKKDAKNATPKEVYEARGLFTDFVISINQTLRGNINKPVIRVRSFFGETGQVRWEDPSQVSYLTGHLYLFFISQGSGPTAIIDPGFYSSVNASASIYEIVDGKAISSTDEWNLDELIAYIQNKLSEPTATSTAIATETVAIETLLSTETSLPEIIPTP